MEISRINKDLTNLYINPQKYVANKGDEKKIGDSIEISEHAKVLRKSGMEPKDLEVIRKKITSGYYNTDEVIQETANRLLESIKSDLKKV